MDWLQHEQTIRTRQRLGANAKQPSEASKAVEVLKGLGWTARTFADLAYALGKEEQQPGGPLRKLVQPNQKRK
jgi:hypothetical protein